jgi:regulator of replication initiation timing
MSRFSDEKLQEMHDDFKSLVVRVEDIDARLEAHVEEGKERKRLEDQRWQEVIRITEANTIANQQTAKAVAEQVQATADLVTAWRDWIGTKRVLIAISKAIAWASSFSVIGSIIYWLKGN